MIRAIELLLVDAIAATAPWLAPVVPAYMVYGAMQAELGFDQWVAVAGALVVEFLGLSAITTTFQFWDWNDSKNQKDPRAPLAVAIAAAVFYLVVVLTVNVILDQATPAHKVAKALLSSLSVIAGIVLAIRSQHARRLAAREQERAERKAERMAKKAERIRTGDLPESSGKFPANNGSYRQNSGQKLDWRNLPLDEKLAIGGMTSGEIMATYGVGDRVARGWRAKARMVHNNGHDDF